MVLSGSRLGQEAMAMKSGAVMVAAYIRAAPLGRWLNGWQACFSLSDDFADAGGVDSCGRGRKGSSRLKERGSGKNG